MFTAGQIDWRLLCEAHLSKFVLGAKIEPANEKVQDDHVLILPAKQIGAHVIDKRKLKQQRRIWLRKVYSSCFNLIALIPSRSIRQMLPFFSGVEI